MQGRICRSQLNRAHSFLSFSRFSFVGGLSGACGASGVLHCVCSTIERADLQFLPFTLLAIFAQGFSYVSAVPLRIGSC